MTRRWFVLSVLLLFIATPAWSQDQAPSPEKLEKALSGVLKDKALSGVKMGVHVRDMADGRQLFARDAEQLLNPASNMKIITAAAVLDRYGPAYTYTTEVYGDSRGDSIQGDLYLSGNGDPFLEWSHLLELAERVRRKGIREVTGDLVVDDSAFDDAFLPPAFEQKNEVAAYRASVSAVAADFGAMTMLVNPGEPGKAPSVSFDPPNDYALITNQATTLEKREEAAKKPLILDLKEENGRSRAILSGTTHTKGGASLRRRVESPSLYSGYLFLQALKTVGIQVKGEVKRGKKDKGRLLARHQSYTMVYLLGAMQKWSNNFMAEMLFKSLALGDGPATWAGAQQRAGDFLKKAGIKEGSYKITNGSGLYDANELSASQFTQVLHYLQQRPDLLPDFETTLAIAGTDGTLKRRMRGKATQGMSRAKTGTLNRVVALSGYAYTQSGRKVAYSILFNDTKGGAWAYRKIQDDFVEALIKNY